MAENRNRDGNPHLVLVPCPLQGHLNPMLNLASILLSKEIGDEMKIPRVVLRTSTAANFLGLSMLNQKACLPAQEGAEKAIEELLPSMRARDMPVFDRFCPETTERVLALIHESTTTASAIIWNTLHALEQNLLHHIQSSLSPPIFPIGPLHKYQTYEHRHRSLFTTEIGVHDAEDRIKCISFLDSHPPGSVVYVSTGSLVRLSQSTLAEMAWGLTNCGQPFLWAVGPSLEDDYDIERLIQSGEELLCAAAHCHRHSPRGLAVAWAPQEEVLAHKSVGCFWTHSGWNSTLESMTEGVPMLCWPRVGDQRIIAGFVSRVWRVGLELECDNDGGLERGRISRAIERVMVGEEGREIKKRALEMKEMLELALGDGGCSSQFLGKLVDFMQLL